MSLETLRKFRNFKKLRMRLSVGIIYLLALYESHASEMMFHKF